MKNLFLTLFVIILVNKLFGQNIHSSNTFIKTNYNHEGFFANKNSSKLFYNAGNSELYLIIDFANFKTGIDSLDEWLDDLSDTKFIYKTVVPTENLPPFSNNGYKSFKLNGTINFNNVAQPHSVEMILYQLLTEGEFHTNAGNLYSDNIRVILQLSFKPKEFKIDKKKHHLKKTIAINIDDGRFNLITPETEHFIH